MIHHTESNHDFLYIDIFVFLLSVLIVYLACQGLNHAAFWDDEAETAIVSRNLLTQGHVTAWDGRNMYTYESGANVNRNLGLQNSPIMYYLTAMSFALFGIGNGSARLPFVLLGFMTLWVFYRLLRRNFADNPWVACYGLASLGLSMNFLLYIRQCRYYSLCLLCACLVFDQYQCFLKNKTWRSVLFLSMSASLFFLSQYLLSLVFFMSLGCVYLIHCAQVRRWEALGRLVCAGLLSMMCSLPYFVVTRAWERTDMAHNTIRWWSVEKLLQIGQYIKGLNDINAMPFLGFLLVLVVLWQKPLWRGPLGMLIVLFGMNTIIMGAFTPQIFYSQGLVEARYLLASIPFAAASMAVALAWLHHYNRFLALGVLCLWVNSNSMVWGSDSSYRWLLPSYWQEIHGPYFTAQQAAAESLAKHAKQDDVVMAVPRYENIPLIFYSGDLVYVCCMVDEKNFLKDYAFLDQTTHYPNWLLLYGFTAESVRWVNFFSRSHIENNELKQYQYRFVERLGVYHGNGQRPELGSHTFVPKTAYNINAEDVYLLKREG